MLAKQKLAVYLKKSVRWDNMSVKKYPVFLFVVKQETELFQSNYHAPITTA
jgi:hypothetical protein